MSRVCLALMAKAPADVVLRAIESARPYVDSVCLVVAPDDPLTSLDLPIPGCIVQHEWEGFGKTRTATLRYAEVLGDWVLVTDAYGSFSGLMPPLDDDSVDAYTIAVVEPKARWWWMRPGHLLRAGRGWEWTASLHETVSCPEPRVSKRWPHLVYSASASPKIKGKGRTYEDDARQLAAELDKNPSNTRAAYYFAQSLKDCGVGRYREAYEAFAARSHMRGGLFDEAWWSVLWMARIAPFIGEDCVPHYLRAHEMMPHRAEPLAGLEHHFRSTGRHNAACTFGVLASTKPFPVDAASFVDLNAYSDDALKAAGIAA